MIARLLVSWGMANQIAINTSIVGKSKNVIPSSFHHVQLLLSFCNLSLQFHQRLTSVIPYPGNRELRSVCADYCYDMRSLLMDTSESLSSQRSVSYSLQICCKYIDFYRIHYVLHYPTEYLYQYYVASFIQVWYLPSCHAGLPYSESRPLGVPSHRRFSHGRRRHLHRRLPEGASALRQRTAATPLPRRCNSSVTSSRAWPPQTFPSTVSRSCVPSWTRVPSASTARSPRSRWSSSSPGARYHLEDVAT